MGAFLDKPKTDKTTASGEGNGIKYGISAMQGWRMEMEDAHVCKVDICFKDSGFFGVFDGHAGPKVAQYCAENLLKSIVDKAEREDIDGTIANAMSEGFTDLDEKIKNQEPWSSGQDRSGTTAVVSLITPDKIVFGNCGDSRGLVCRNQKVLFSTEDHKPYMDAERKRIEKAGGTVLMQRVNGSLAVSRALGDFAYKQIEHLPPKDQLVSPEPEVTILERDLDNDQFLILACDGIFDVMTNEEVVLYVHHQLSLTHDLPKICSNLIDKCLNKNSRDNMSVILVQFPGAPAVSQDAIHKEEESNKECEEMIDEALKKIVEKAADTLDLEENDVLSQLGELIKTLHPNFDVYTKREEICTFLAEQRTIKFGVDNDKDFSGPTDATDARSPFFDDHMSDLGVSEQRLSPLQSPSESDTVNTEDTSSTPNIM